MPDLPALSDADRRRYARHLSIPGVGEDGQQRLKASSVLCIGTGGLGSPAALYLAAAGVGRIGLVDDDVVDESNLQRQILHGQSSIGRPKLESALDRLAEINPQIQVKLHPGRFTPDNASAMLDAYDLLLDGSDNFPTRFLSNDACFLAGKPCIYGSIFRFEGQITVFAPHLGGPCYRCMLPNLPAPGAAPTCAEAGVLGVLPGIIGSLQAMEAIKFLLQIGEPPLGRLVCYDALSTQFRTLRLSADPACRLCGESPDIRSVRSLETLAPPSCILSEADIPTLTPEALSGHLEAHPQAILIDVRQPQEHALASIPGSRLIPLPDLPARLEELPRDGATIIVHCKSGARSIRAARLLLDEGFPEVSNLQGGIDAWLKLDQGFAC